MAASVRWLCWRRHCAYMRTAFGALSAERQSRRASCVGAGRGAAHIFSLLLALFELKLISHVATVLAPAFLSKQHACFASGGAGTIQMALRLVAAALGGITGRPIRLLSKPELSTVTACIVFALLLAHFQLKGSCHTAQTSWHQRCSQSSRRVLQWAADLAVGGEIDPACVAFTEQRQRYLANQLTCCADSEVLLLCTAQLTLKFLKLPFWHALEPASGAAPENDAARREGARQRCATGQASAVVAVQQCRGQHLTSAPSAQGCNASETLFACPQPCAVAACTVLAE
jgi:hypothetical protein